MTKVAEQVIEDGSRIIIKETHDLSQVLKSAADLRSNGQTGFSENKHVARVPMALIAQWARDAGSRWDDKPAMQEMLSRKLMSGEFSQFRVWEGRF